MSSKSQREYWWGKELKSYEFEALTITAIALGFSVAKLSETDYEDAIRAFVTVEDNPVRYKTDGTDPTSTEGHLVNPGGVIIIEGITELTRFKAIRTTSSDAKLQITYQRYAV